MLCGIPGLTSPFCVTMCSNCSVPLLAWIATILLNEFGLSDFQITSPACSPFASSALVSSRAVTVHSPVGASCSSVFDASGSLAMKSPCRIGRPRLPLDTVGPPPPWRSTVHLGSSALPWNSSDCGRQLSPPPPSGWIVNDAVFGGSSTLPARSRERKSTVWLPSVPTVKLVTNGLALPVLSLRVQAPPSMRYSVHSTPVPLAPSVALSVTVTGRVPLVAAVVVGAAVSSLTTTWAVLDAFSPSAYVTVSLAV